MQPRAKAEQGCSRAPKRRAGAMRALRQRSRVAPCRPLGLQDSAEIDMQREVRRSLGPRSRGAAHLEALKGGRCRAHAQRERAVEHRRGVRVSGAAARLHLHARNNHAECGTTGVRGQATRAWMWIGGDCGGVERPRGPTLQKPGALSDGTMAH
eukprot:3289689-Prymnesium_polylepis.1